jgi:hypothetical protein
MFLDASGFHAGSFAPALSGRKVHPVYRLHCCDLQTEMALVAQIGKVPDENGENRQRNMDMETHPAMRFKAIV